MLDLSPQELISLNKIKMLGAHCLIAKIFLLEGTIETNKTKYTTTKVVGVLVILL